MEVSKGTIVRLIGLTVAKINTALAMFGLAAQIPFCESGAYLFVTIAFDVVVAYRSYWKNNSWTANALEADEVLFTMNALDREEIDADGTDPEM